VVAVAAEMTATVRTILCIPGTWGNEQAFASACAGAGLRAAGAFLVDPLLGAHCEVELRAREPQMRDAFDSASGAEIDEDELSAIDGHETVAYLIAETGSLERVRALVQLATRLLPHGGLGIKVESAGVAAPIETWLALSIRLDPFVLIRCFVVVGNDAGELYSCGMHNLGFRDAVVAGVPVDIAKPTLDRFNLYQLVDRPELRDGESFGAEQSGRFVMRMRPCTRFPVGDPFHNPFGVVQLVR
jgi:hypothetical protein